MKVVLLAGGFGTRISEESHTKPKPMIQIGNMPILWHIMKEYSYYGFNEFIICGGYKQEIIKEYFNNYSLYNSDVTFNMKTGEKIIHQNHSEDWKVTVVNTGLHTMTGGRIKRIKDYIDDDTFLLTYGDGVCDINIKEVIKFHKKHGKLATMTAIQPGGRFGSLSIDENETINNFAEKTKEAGGWINAGYMILNKKVLDYIEGDKTIFEKLPLETLASEGQLKAYKYDGFWQSMDTLKDKIYLDELIEKNEAPWMKWNK